MDDPVSLRALDDDRWQRLVAGSTPAPVAAVTRQLPPVPFLDVAVDLPLAPRTPVVTGKQVAPIAVRDARDVAAQQKLDAFRESMTGTYRTPDGKELRVATPFKMTGGYINQKEYLAANDHQHLRERDAVAAVAHLPPGAYGRILCGRGTPGEIHAFTQALLDAQPPGTIGTAADLRQLMFDNGIGVDCAGYVQQAYLSVTGQTRGQARLAGIVDESLSNLASKGFVNVSAVGDLRPGDIVALGAPPGESVGHRTIVYDQHVATAPEMRALLASGQRAQVDFALGGPVRLLQVDSSWGCGVLDDARHVVVGQASAGGVLRETWLYNDTTQQWASWDKASGRFWTSATPYAHPLDGFFRKGP